MTESQYKTALANAYQTKVTHLFDVLTKNMLSMSEEDAIEKYKRGLESANRAYELAASVGVQ